MRSMIFGVGGQDGSYLAELLLKEGHEVIGVARRTSTGNLDRLTVLEHKNFRLVRGDITDYAAVYSTLSRYVPDHIYNLAAQSHVGTSFNEPLSSLDITGKGCLNILEAIRQLSDEYAYSPRFYQASSSEMFGSAYSTKIVDQGGNDLDGYKIEEKYQNEDTPFQPQSPYAVAKLTAHKFCGMYREAYNIHARCGILFNHEGERRGEEFVTRKITKYIAKLVHSIKQEKRIPLLKLGDVSPTRDWGHAEDYVKAMKMIMDSDLDRDWVVSTGYTYTIRQFLEEAFEFVELDYINHVSLNNSSLLRPAEVNYLKGDSSQIRALLGWKPLIDFPQLVKRMVKHDIENYKE